jgi:cytochrome c oxidase cbb3-type subunit 1
MSAASHHSPARPPAAEAAATDASVRLPVLVLLGFAVLWLLTASALGLVAAMKLHTPSFLASCEFLTYGRVYPAALNAFVWGWGINAGLAVALWLMARLARATLPGAGLLTVAAVAWNIGVKLGVAGILAGWSSAVPWLELPRHLLPFLLVIFTLLAAWVVGLLRRGASPRLYVSQWWLLAALFWLPWVWSAAGAMLFVAPVRGTVQSLVGAWFTHNLLALWFAPVALAVVYYLLPKLLGKPVRAYWLAPLGFWSYALFTTWAGASRLVGAPVPAWVPVSGQVACFMLTLPLVIIAPNLLGPLLCGGLAALRRSVALRFAAVAAFCFCLHTLRLAVGAFPGVAGVTRLTWFDTAADYAVLYGEFSFAVFAAACYFVPRLVLRPWWSASLLGAHFWLSLSGLLLGMVSLSVGGLLQGGALAEGTVAFADIAARTQPWLQAATLGGVLLVVGQLAFAVNLVKTVLCPCHRAATAAAPTPPSAFAAPELEPAHAP